MEKLDLITMTYEVLIKEESSRPVRKGAFRHFPSALCARVGDEFVGKCRRATYYQMTGVEPSNPIDAVALWKMKMGDVIHDELSKTLDRALVLHFGGKVKIDAETEKSFYANFPGLKFPVSGRVDKVVHLQSEEKTVVIAGEWKSTYGFGVDQIQKNGAKLDNLLQCLAYLEQKEFPIDFIWLIYVARDSGFMYGFQIEKDGNQLISRHLNSDVVKVYDIHWQQVVDALQIVEECVEGGVIPERDYDGQVNPKTNKLMIKSPWQCKYCSYMSLCYGCDA